MAKTIMYNYGGFVMSSFKQVRTRRPIRALGQPQSRGTRTVSHSRGGSLWSLGFFTIAILVMGMFVLSSAFASGTKEATSSSKTKTIEFIPTSNATPYFLDEYAGVKKEAAKFGYKTTFQAPSVSVHISKEINLVRQAVADQVNGIILVPYSPTALVAPAKEAEKAGIPVISTDSNLNSGAKTFIAVNDAKAAEAVAKYAADFVHDQGQYAIIDYNLSTTSGRLRRKGFETEMNKIPGMKFAGLQISHSLVQTALHETTAMLERNPKINVIFGANDRSALGVAEAVKRLGLQNTVCVVGFDADLGEINYIKSGVIKASALQSPVTMGEWGVKALRQVWAGKTLPAYEPLPFHIVTYKNYSTPNAVAAIQQYLLNYKG